MAKNIRYKAHRCHTWQDRREDVVVRCSSCLHRILDRLRLAEEVPDCYYYHHLFSFLGIRNISTRRVHGWDMSILNTRSSHRRTNDTKMLPCLRSLLYCRETGIWVGQGHEKMTKTSRSTYHFDIVMHDDI